MKNLKLLRKKLQLTQAQAARLAGVQPNTWARWEQEVHSPRGAAKRVIELLPWLVQANPPQRRGD
jgi:DNA-binding transcriptional regulator YiaG